VRHLGTPPPRWRRWASSGRCWRNASTADRLAAQLLAACHGGTLPLTVDLRQVTQLTSAAVRVLYRVNQQLNAHQRELTLRTVPGSRADAVLTMAQLRTVSSNSETGR
jgi:anti-anti-sigma regulatory factor